MEKQNQYDAHDHVCDLVHIHMLVHIYTHAPGRIFPSASLRGGITGIISLFVFIYILCDEQ